MELRGSTSGSAGGFAGDPQLRRELQASIGALKELGPGYEQELVDSFMSRLGPALDARVVQQSSRGAVDPNQRPRLRSLVLGAGGIIAALVLLAGGTASMSARHSRVFERRHMYMRMHVHMNPQHVTILPFFPSRPPAAPVPPAPPAPRPVE